MGSYQRCWPFPHPSAPQGRRGGNAYCQLQLCRQKFSDMEEDPRLNFLKNKISSVSQQYFFLKEKKNTKKPPKWELHSARLNISASPHRQPSRRLCSALGKLSTYSRVKLHNIVGPNELSPAAQDRERSHLHPPPPHSWPSQSHSKLAGTWAGLLPAWGGGISPRGVPYHSLREAFLKVCYNKISSSSLKRSRPQLMVNDQ